MSSNKPYGVTGQNRHSSCKAFMEYVGENSKWVHLRCNRCDENEFIPIHVYYDKVDPPADFKHHQQSTEWHRLKHRGHL